MAEDADSDIFFFYEPEMRGLLPIDAMHVPTSLAKTLSQGKLGVTVNTAFADVIDGCAQTTAKRPKTWINKPIRDVFVMLHQAGYAHSVECWNDGGDLAGGLYGLALGGVFFGESMFSRETDASKVALAHLMARLWAGEFTLCDIQFINDHLARFGAYEIPQSTYLSMLEKALTQKAVFTGPYINNQFESENDLIRAYLESLT